MTSSERELQASIRSSLLHGKFQQLILKKCEIANPQNFKLFGDIELEYTTGNQRGDSKLDLYCRFKDISKTNEVSIGIELKTPTNSANKKQLSDHLYTLGLKKKDSWNPKQKKANKRVYLIVISKGNFEDKEVTSIKNKYRSYANSIFWFSWHEIRDFIEKNDSPYHKNLKNDLNKSGIIHSESTFSATTTTIKSMIKTWQENIGKAIDERTKVEHSLDSLDFIMEKKGYIIKSSSKKPRSGDAYSFSKLVNYTKINSFTYREYQKKNGNNKSPTAFFGLDFTTGQWRGSIVPINFNKDELNHQEHTIKHFSNTSRKLTKKVWKYKSKTRCEDFYGWNFTSGVRSPKKIAKFLDNILNY